VVLAVGVAAGSVAYAAIPDAGGLIHGCYKKSSPNQGTLRVVDSEKGQTCSSSETSVNWNQTGLQGAPGPSDAYAVSSNGADLGDNTTLVSVDVPAGAYTVVAKTYVYDNPFAQNPGDKIVACELDSGSTIIDEVEDRLDQLGADGTNDDDEVLTFIGTTQTTASSTTIKLVCSGDGIVTDLVKLIATKVGTLH
jgi:hypothetical protein